MSFTETWRNLLPPSVAVVDAAISDAAAGELTAEERGLAAHFGPKRVAQFATGRSCARAALAALDVSPAPVLMDGRSPVWPSGLVGSISHTDHYAVAAVARASEFASIGVDVESCAELTPAVADRIASSDELDALPGAERMRWAVVLFSAKEAFYKLQHPLTGTFLGFKDVRAHLLGPATFTIELLRPAGPFAAHRHFPGRYARMDDLLLTAMTLPARGS